MADPTGLGKPKKLLRRAPPADEVSGNIFPPPIPEPAPDVPPARIVDGRSLRRTGRTVMFGTRVTPEFDNQLRRIAMEQGLTLVEVLERALNLYQQQQATK